MYLKFLQYETIGYIKNNISTIYENLNDKSFVTFLNEKLGLDWFKNSKFLKPEIDFLIDMNIPPRETDFDNSVKVYEALKNLTQSQASDERIWGGLAVESEVYNYLKYRWGDTANTIKYRVIYHEKGKRGFMYHGIARLWWFAHITHDKSYDDPYELTRFAFNYPHILEKMLYRNFSNSKVIRTGILKGIYAFIKNGGKYSTVKMDKLFKYVSTIGSVNLIDNKSELDIIELVVLKLNEM